MINNKLKATLMVLLLLGIFSLTVQAQNYSQQTRYWKYGLSASYIATENIKLFLIDADKTSEQDADKTLYGLFAERIFFDEFGLGFSLLRASKSIDFTVNKAADSKLNIKTTSYHAMFNFITYLGKNRTTGFLFAFEAAIGYLFNQATLTSDNFYYFDAASKQFGNIPDFEEKLDSNFITSTFMGKVDWRFTSSGVRLSGGIITGGSFEKASFSIPNFKNKGVIGVKNTYDQSFVVSLEVYAFD